MSTAAACHPSIFTGAPSGPSDYVVVAEGAIPEMERLLRECRSAGLDATLGGKECCSGGGCGPKAALLLQPHELATFQRLMSSRWSDALAREGGADPEVLARLEAAQAAGELACPACGHVGDLVDGECADCGLALG